MSKLTIQNKIVTVFTQLWLQSQVPTETSKRTNSHLSDWGTSASKQHKGAPKVPLISTEAIQREKKVDLA